MAKIFLFGKREGDGEGEREVIPEDTNRSTFAKVSLCFKSYHPKPINSIKLGSLYSHCVTPYMLTIAVAFGHVKILKIYVRLAGKIIIPKGSDLTNLTKLNNVFSGIRITSISNTKIFPCSFCNPECDGYSCGILPCQNSKERWKNCNNNRY
jgi:hypothetical protein